MNGAFNTVDPSTGAVLERFDRMTSGQVDTRLQSAAGASNSWRRAGVDERAALLRAIGARLRSQRERLAATAVREMGKPVIQALAEVDKCAASCDYFSAEGARLLEPQPVARGQGRYVAFRPLGVLLAIMPWNFPYWQVFRAVIPALLTGNAVLLKHAEITTRCGLEIEALVRDAGAPDGLFATLLMTDDDVDAIIADSRIAAVTLTGSERAGMAVGSAAGAALKKCVLELGGSDAFVVLADADLDAAASTAVFARFQNNGQSCIAAKRFVVESSAYDAFVERFVRLAGAQIVGDPSDPATQIGPCARADLRDGIASQVRETIAAGGRLLLGGAPIDRPGFYFAPTIVSDPPPGSPMREREVFGPAAAVIRAEDEREALRIVNETDYGLGCGIWTRDVERGERLSAEVDAGMVFVNALVASDPALPFGGVKRSGFGRELASYGVHEFANVQSVVLAEPD